MQERIDFTFFILPHIVRERKDSSALIIKKNINFDKKTEESIQFLQAVPWAPPLVPPLEIVCFPSFFHQGYYILIEKD